MTVQELIEQLQNIGDKNKICLVDDGGGGTLGEIKSVYDAQYVQINIRYSDKYC